MLPEGHYRSRPAQQLQWMTTGQTVPINIKRGGHPSFENDGVEGAMPQHTPITCITMRSIRRQDATPFWKRVSSLRGSTGPPAQGRIAPFIVRNALHCFWRGFASIPNQSSQLWCAGPSILWNFEICWTIDICFSSNWGERGLGGWMGPYAAKTRTLNSGSSITTTTHRTPTTL